MEKMLDNCTYNKIKLLHELSCILWFLKKHGIQDASKAGDKECLSFCEQLEKDLEEHISHLKDMIC